MLGANISVKNLDMLEKHHQMLEIHQYPNLVVDVNHKYKVVTITYNQQETPRGLPLSVLTHYIGCWSNTQKMHAATQRIIDNPEYEFVYNPFLPQSY